MSSIPFNSIWTPRAPQPSRLGPWWRRARNLSKWLRDGITHFAAGDILLDASGNRILDASGNVMLDDGAGNTCCCVTTFTCPAAPCLTTPAYQDLAVTGWTAGASFFNQSHTFSGGGVYHSYALTGTLNGVYTNLVNNPGELITNAAAEFCNWWGAWIGPIGSDWATAYAAANASLTCTSVAPNQGCPWVWPVRTGTLGIGITFYTGTNLSGTAYTPPYQALSAFVEYYGHDPGASYTHGSNSGPIGSANISLQLAASDNPESFNPSGSPHHVSGAFFLLFDTGGFAKGSAGNFPDGDPGANCLSAGTASFYVGGSSGSGSVTATGHN